MRALLILSALVALPASAQTDRLEKARAEINTVENAADRAVYACSRNDVAKCLLEARTAANAASRALYAIDQAIAATKPTTPTVADVKAVASGLNVAALLGPKSIPPSGKPDVVGAFRFLCGPGQISNDDPIVYPGQPGKAHMHQFFGNLEADANSTYESLRKSGESTCQNALNRSAYWMPAMLDGKGNVVRPDRVAIYYKRRPVSDPFCTTAASGCVGIPQGLRFVFGWDQSRPTEPQPENNRLFNFKCAEGDTPTTPSHPNLIETAKVCGPGQRIVATISTPQCWDGVNLDSPNHRSHLADMKRDASTGYVFKCPATHPKIIPQFTMSVTYSVETGDEPTLWHLSSDHMTPEMVPGSTFHSDYFEGWEDSIRLRWEAACLDKLLNCSDGDLGDGAIMLRGPHYPYGKASPRLVPVQSQR